MARSAWRTACCRTPRSWQLVFRRRTPARWFTPQKFSPPALPRPRISIIVTSIGAWSRKLGITGVLGAILGAWILSNVEVTSARRFVYAYLLVMGLYILWKSVRIAVEARKPAGWTALLGFAGGFLDASGGGGWGPLTTSTLVGSGHAPRYSVGSVNTTEFFVTIAAATTFFSELGAVALDHLLPLVLGGVLAAPFGGWLVKKVPAQKLMTAVGLLIVAVSIFQLLRAFRIV